MKILKDYSSLTFTFKVILLEKSASSNEGFISPITLIKNFLFFFFLQNQHLALQPNNYNTLVLASEY